MSDEKHLEFEGFSVGSISDLVTTDRFGWIDLNLGFKERNFQATAAITVRVPIQYTRSMTINQVRQAAFEKARLVIESAYLLTDSNNLEEIQRLHDERAAVAAIQLERLQNPEIDP